MRTLAIETATEACSIALFDGGQVIAHDHRVLGRGHAEQLVPMIADLPDKGRANRILVSLGPGSFTGVRIGIATARALGFAFRAEVRGYPTLALIAAMAQSEGADGVTVCMAGGHGEWFVADFDPGPAQRSSMQSLNPVAAKARGAQPHIAGSKAQEFAKLLAGEVQAHDLLPDARYAIGLPETLLSDDLAPIYGRAPDVKPQKQRQTP